MFPYMGSQRNSVSPLVTATPEAATELGLAPELLFVLLLVRASFEIAVDLVECVEAVPHAFDSIGHPLGVGAAGEKLKRLQRLLLIHDAVGIENPLESLFAGHHSLLLVEKGQGNTAEADIYPIPSLYTY